MIEFLSFTPRFAVRGGLGGSRIDWAVDLDQLLTGMRVSYGVRERVIVGDLEVVFTYVGECAEWEDTIN